MYSKRKLKLLINGLNKCTGSESMLMELLDRAYDSNDVDDALWLVKWYDDTWASRIETLEEAKYIVENYHLEHDCINKGDLHYRKMTDSEMNSALEELLC